MKYFVLSIVVFVAVLGFLISRPPKLPERKVIRVAVIGGMTMTGMWQALAAEFEAETNYKVEVVVTGPKQVLVDAFHKGEADLLTMHSSDATTDLVADGYGINMHPWTRNQLVIVGPPSDPAHIKGMHDGAAALRKIAQTQSPFVDHYSNGAREVAHKIWAKAGVAPHGAWLIKDESAYPQGILEYAKSHDAYVIVGRIPVIQGKMPSEGMEIMVEDDPDMVRPYMVMEANPSKFPKTNVVGAHALADYLISERAKVFLRTFGSQQPDGIPLFHPLPDVTQAAENPQ